MLIIHVIAAVTIIAVVIGLWSWALATVVEDVMIFLRNDDNE